MRKLQQAIIDINKTQHNSILGNPGVVFRILIEKIERYN